MANTRSILIASADRLFAESASVLLSARDEWIVKGVFSDGLAALAAGTRGEADVLLVLGEVERLSVRSLCERIRTRRPVMQVVALGSDAGRAGTSLPGDATFEDVLRELTADPVVTPEGSMVPSAQRAEAVALLEKLTKRERTVLRALAGGSQPKEVAEELGLSDHTVRTHMQNLYRKLGKHSRLDIVRFAFESGIVGREAEG